MSFKEYKVSHTKLEWQCDNFLKTPEYPKGLELDIPYYNYGFVIEVQEDPDNFNKQQERDQLKKELCEENWIVFR
ncbi:21338_t:CDS:2, partial [Gigaspora margarita]